MNWKVKTCIVVEVVASGVAAGSLFYLAYQYSPYGGLFIGALVVMYVTNNIRQFLSI